MADKKILIVEDESIVALHIEKSLKNIGYAVTGIVDSGEDAVKKAGIMLPDLVLMDIVLKGEMDGIEAADQIRARFNIPVIFLTAYGDENTLQRAKVTEPFGYILKPFKERDLHVAIEIALYKHDMESRVKNMERWLATILKSIGDAVIATDVEARITFMNPVAEKLTGHDKTNALGRKLTEVFNLKDMGDEEVYVLEERILNEVIKEGMIINLIDNRMLIARDGKEIPIADSAAPIRDDEGNVPGMVLAFRDITERKKADEFIKGILEAIDEGFVVIDREYRIISANKAYLNMVNMPTEAILGKRCYEISHGIPKPCYEMNEECAVRHTFATGEPCTAMHIHRHSAGDSIYVETKSYPLKDHAGNIISAIEIINNVTEKKKLGDQLRQAQKMEAIGQLASGIAHDFNNILTTIIGFGSLLRMRIKESGDLRTYMDEVLAAAERAANLTRSLLALSRKQEINPMLVNVNEIIRRIEKLLARLIGEDIEFKTTLADKDLTVMADSGQIEQVIMNLATNARDAMPDGGLLTISTECVEFDSEFIRAHGYDKPGMYALISVSDTGMGMNEETKEKIFEPFFTTKPAGAGTGLGLSIVYGIIRQHQGYINVYSEPQKGTTFRIFLPLVKATSEVIRPAETVVSERGAETVLLAEDDANVRKLTRAILEEFGYSVIEATNGEEAVKYYVENKDKIRLLVFDVIMPVKGGKEAFDEIKMITPGIKALFLSGYTMDIINRKGIVAEGLNFVSKPVSPHELLKKIRDVLDKKG